MFRPTTSISVILFGIASVQVVQAGGQDVFDLVDQISDMSFFVPGIGTILGTSMKLVSVVGRLSVNNNKSNGGTGGSNWQNSLAAKKLSKVSSSLNEMRSQIPNEVQIKNDLAELYDEKITRVRDFYNDYVSKYHSEIVSYKSQDAKNFVKQSYSSRTGVKYILDSIAQILSGERQSQTLLQRLQMTGDLEVLLCSKDNSHQVRIIQIYHDVLEIELEALELALFRFNVTTHFAEDLQEISNALIELQYYVKNFEKRCMELQPLIKETMEKAPREFWKCDPNSRAEGDISIKLDPLFRTIMVPESDLKTTKKGSLYEVQDFVLNDVSGDCDRFKEAQIKNESEHSIKNRCQGTIRNCYDCNEDATICVNRKGHINKYEYVKFEDGGFWGRKDASCDEIMHLERYRSLDGVNDLCLCTCDEDQNDQAARYFSTLECFSDYHDNKVITGVRFVLRRNFIHFEIQQAALEKNGDVGKLTWSSNCTNKSETDFALKSNLYRVSWQNNNINLDDLSCSTETVVTGIKFGNENGSLRLELRCTTFNFSSGQLDRHDHSVVYVSGERPNMKIDNHLPTPTGNTYVLDGLGSSINFVKSNDEQDVGSTLLPWLDSRRVSMKNPTPLAGVSLIHRSGKQSSGYLALKITSLDFSQYFEPGLEDYLFKFANYTLDKAKKAVDSIHSLQNNTAQSTRKA